MAAAAEVAGHFDQVYGAKVSKDTIYPTRDKVVEEMTNRFTGPSAVRCHPALCPVAVVARGGQVARSSRRAT
ncbi:hypothetical protein OG470_06365 [Micromonospora sp. NBC_00389]|uniref:hypothetical protein n=1 Tax=Micromonospora sp. NBC_00389 TaxID=2903586 RepID=UPI002E1DAACB